MAEQNLNTVVNIRIPAGLRNKLNYYLRQTGQNISEFTRIRIEDYLNKFDVGVPFPEIVPLQTTCARNLDTINDDRTFAAKLFRIAVEIPRFGYYDNSPETESSDPEIRQLRKWVETLHETVDKLNRISEELADIAITNTKRLISHDKRLISQEDRLKNVLLNLTAIIERQNTIE